MKEEQEKQEKLEKLEKDLIQVISESELVDEDALEQIAGGGHGSGNGCCGINFSCFNKGKTLTQPDTPQTAIDGDMDII